MKKYLTYNDEKSDKFWSIDVSGKSFTVTYGKAGTAGTSQTKKFASESLCMKEAEKLVNEKLKKGYTLSNAKTKVASKTKSPDYLKEWEAIVNAKDLHKALSDHFKYLADTPGFEPVLKAIMKEAKSAAIVEECLHIEFDGDTLVATAPGEVSRYKKWPKSFQNAIARHGDISLQDAMLHLGNHGGFDASYLEDVDSQWLELVTSPQDVLCPMQDYSDWWLYHPTEKNSFGEPTIHFFSHEGGDAYEEPHPHNVGSFFLTRMDAVLVLGLDIPEIRDTKSIDRGTKPWWEYLKHIVLQQGSETCSYNYVTESGDETLSAAAWNAEMQKEIIENITELTFEDIPSLKIIPLAEMKKLEELNIYNYNKVKIETLEGIESVTSLRKLFIEDNNIVDLSALRFLPKLEYLRAGFNKIISVEALVHCRELEYLYLNNNKVRDVSSLAKLSKLKTLWLSRNPVKDLTAITTMESLRSLQVPFKRADKEVEKIKGAMPGLEEIVF